MNINGFIASLMDIPDSYEVKALENGCLVLIDDEGGFLNLPIVGPAETPEPDDLLPGMDDLGDEAKMCGDCDGFLLSPGTQGGQCIADESPCKGGTVNKATAACEQWTN